MTSIELSLCLAAVFSSSSSQLFIKMASKNPLSLQGILMLAGSGLLMLVSIFVLIWVLRTIQLSQVMPIAAGAYILVPLGSWVFLKERLHPRFWLGVVSIMLGIYLTA